MLALLGAIGLWQPSMQTLSLMLVAVVFSVVLGIPMGIAMASFRWVRAVMLPILDVMQTMPSFVYLIPVVMLFNLGKLAALFATVIYAVPPVIRLATWGFAWWMPRCWRPRAPLGPAGYRDSCSACSCRWRCPTSWPASTEPP
ncbi:hypothetical protein CDEF62S_02864 [Castellaniella defragrans]